MIRPRSPFRDIGLAVLCGAASACAAGGGRPSTELRIQHASVPSLVTEAGPSEVPAGEVAGAPSELLPAASLSGLALNAQDAGGAEADDLARELANPNASLGALAMLVDYIDYDGDLPGASSESGWRTVLQPSLPYALSETTNLFIRPAIPIVLDQPVPFVANQPDAATTPTFSDTDVELGDISFDIAVGKSLPSGLVVAGGVVGTLPTATDDSVGLDQFLLGPEVFVGSATDWGFLGMLFTHQWDVAGEDDFSTSISGGQYFYTLNLGNAWQIQAQPTFSYNHNAPSGEELTLPLGLGIAKTTRVGKLPVKFALQFWHYIERPDAFGPENQIRFSIIPIVPLPW